MSGCSQCNDTGEESLLGGPCRYCPPQLDEWRTVRCVSFVLAVALVVVAIACMVLS